MRLRARKTVQLECNSSPGALLVIPADAKRRAGTGLPRRHRPDGREAEPGDGATDPLARIVATRRPGLSVAFRAVPDSACGASGMTKVRHRRRAGRWTLKAKNSATGVQRHHLSPLTRSPQRRLGSRGRALDGPRPPPGSMIWIPAFAGMSGCVCVLLSHRPRRLVYAPHERWGQKRPSKPAKPCFKRKWVRRMRD